MPSTAKKIGIPIPDSVTGQLRIYDHRNAERHASVKRKPLEDPNLVLLNALSLGVRQTSGYLLWQLHRHHCLVLSVHLMHGYRSSPPTDSRKIIRLILCTFYRIPLEESNGF